LEWKHPQILQFLRDTNAPLLSWIRTVPYFSRRMSFDFGASGRPNDTWTSCYKISAVQNYVPAAIVTAEVGVLASMWLGPTIVVAQAASLILTTGALVMLETIAFATRVRFDGSKYYEHPSSLRSALKEEKQMRQQPAIQPKRRRRQYSPQQAGDTTTRGKKKDQ
jgi:hypothetical protein